MLIRYRPWASDGLPGHTRDLNLRRYIFEDANQGIVDVRVKEDLETFLRDRHYELVYATYGVAWDADGVEIEQGIPAVSKGDVPIPGPNAPSPPPAKRKPGRPKGR